jgi:hypothetical protein
MLITLLSFFQFFIPPHTSINYLNGTLAPATKKKFTEIKFPLDKVFLPGFVVDVIGNVAPIMNHLQALRIVFLVNYLNPSFKINPAKSDNKLSLCCCRFQFRNDDDDDDGRCRKLHTLKIPKSRHFVGVGGGV